MKKILTTTLVIAMMAAMSVTAFAATPIDGGEQTSPKTGLGVGEYTIGVDAKYTDEVTTDEIVSVDVEWGDMEFTYTTAGRKVWNPKTHTYSVSDEMTGWSEHGNTVKVTNHSNIAVNAKFTYAKDATNDPDGKMTGAFTYDKTANETTGLITLNAGTEASPNTADHVTATLKLSGTPDSTMTSFKRVGNITIELSK